MREYKGLLEKSIYYNDKSFFNFYKLSLVAEKHHAKNILRKGFLNIKRISTVQELQEMKIREFLDYDRYLNEFILGTEVDEFSYKDIEAYYNSL